MANKNKKTATARVKATRLALLLVTLQVPTLMYPRSTQQETRANSKPQTAQQAEQQH